MSHDVIITQPPTDDGDDERRAPSVATVTIAYSPQHALTPAQERKRIDRADEMAARIVEMLNKPAHEAVD